MLDKLQSIEERYLELENRMADPELATDYGKIQTLAQERASIADIVELYRGYKKTAQDLTSARTLLQESDDEEMRSLARDEIAELEARQGHLEEALRVALLPRDPNDEKSVIVEIRAGTGGEEAALFAAELYRSYSRYAERRGWKTEPIDINETGIGGIKEVVFEIRGKGAYSRLKHESGVHRVQRVPVTESGGRIHTSTATVAVLPEAEEVDVDISPEDLRIDIYHASGHGGQNVQKVATAVRITHLPTGIVTTCQDERSQLRNKQKAMAVLRSRLLNIEITRQQKEISASRRSQVGTGERSEKVRTYNYPQNRVTDHRIGLTRHNLEAILDGDLDEFIDNLITEEQAAKLQEVMA